MTRIKVRKKVEVIFDSAVVMEFSVGFDTEDQIEIVRQMLAFEDHITKTFLEFKWANEEG